MVEGQMKRTVHAIESERLLQDVALRPYLANMERARAKAAEIALAMLDRQHAPHPIGE